MQLDKPLAHASTGWSMVKDGARRTWRWLTYPWTWSATQTASMVDAGPMGQQLRTLDGRAQVHGAAIEIMSAQVNDIARDHARIMSLLDKHTGLFERFETALGRLVQASDEATKNSGEMLRFAAEARDRLFETRTLPQDMSLTRSELNEGMRRMQLTLAEETASLRSRLASLPSSEQVNSLMGQSNGSSELSATRALISDEFEKIQRALAAQSSTMQERLAALPSTENVHLFAGGGGVSDEVASVRRALGEEMRKLQESFAQETQHLHGRLASLPSSSELQKVQDTLAEVTAGLNERLAQLPTTAQFHGLIDGGMTAEFANAKKELFDEVTTIHEALAQETARVHDRMQAALAQELSSARAQLSGDVQKLHDLLAQETAAVQARLATLPSAEQMQSLVGSNSLTHEIATTRAQVADGLQKVQQALIAQKADVSEKLAMLPSTEQIHAFVEGGTANSIQSSRRMFTEESQRGQIAADRMTRKLEFLQSRSVIPLTAQGLVLCRNPLGFLAVPADDLATIASLADGVLPEPGAIKAIEKYLKPGGTFVDVGANVGVFTLLAANVVGPTGKVISVEPAPATARALRATVDANGLAGVVSVKEVAAGSEQGLGTLSLAQNLARSTLLPTDHSNGSVVTPVVPLDELLAGTTPDMVKIDVEGFEPKVIEGMRAVLNANPNLIVIMDFEPAHIRETGLSAAGWVEQVVGAGLQIFEIDERSGELSPLRKRGLEEIQSINILVARSDPSRRTAEASNEGWLKLGPATLPS